VNGQNTTQSAEISVPRPGISISKIAHIRDIGRFRNYTSQGDVTFKKFTLIFGENGRGKTTLCAILRSLQTRSSAFIQGRRTLGSLSNPQVKIALTSGQALFHKGAWTPPFLDINLKIFDAHYIAENIYSGDAIGSDQRRNLCRVILGQQGVALANRYDEIDKEIAELNAVIRAARGIIASHAGPLQAEKFVELESEPNIDTKIEAKTIEVQGLKETDHLKQRVGLSKMDMPPLPLHLETMLNRTLEDVSRDAESQVRAHITRHAMMAHGEEWIAAALPNITGDTCPFCGQSLRGLELLRAYREFFNERYRELQNQLTRYRASAARLFSDEKIELLGARVSGNATSADLWGRYVAIGKPDPLDLNLLTSSMTKFRSELLAVLDKKLASPLDPTDLPDSYGVARKQYEALSQAVDAYNRQVATANAAIETFKVKADANRKQIVERELAVLRVKKARFLPEISEACKKFISASSAKTRAEEEKRKVRNQLNSYSESVLIQYKKSINDYLKRFASGFYIDRVKVEYSGRVPNSTFCIVINDTAVDAGSEDTPLDQPSFRNTLSSGDRSTLALAFFFAQLKQDPDMSRCVAIFDDPFNSQDQFRRTCTISEVQRCGDHVAQVVVMSHDRHFLKTIWDLPLPASDRKALWLVPSGKQDTAIGEWDIDGDTESEDASNRRVLLEFYYQPGKSDPRDVIKKLRPVAETHMCRLAPEQLKDIKGMGLMIQKIRTDQNPISLLESLHDLTDINTYTRRYMHGENPNASSEQISRTELHGFVGKLLEIAGAMPG
jgi:wobble nucleotide-excising tRNase